METYIDKLLKNFNIIQFQSDLIEWFLREQRQLPWRKDKDPYKIWVSEVMLQQTKVETVIPYFNRFMEQFPTLETLAKADENSVLKAWEGLGYYSRARHLHHAVKEVVSKYGGKVPNHAEALSKLQGVGPYTKGAILSIAYGLPEPAVDGNVMRVLSRILHISDDITKTKTRKLFEQVIRKLISVQHPSEFNQSLMELGALVCKPKSPECFLCPVQNHCVAYKKGIQDELPYKTSKKAGKKVRLSALLVTNKDGNYLIQKRASKGLLANLWEFPNHEVLLGSTQGEVEQLIQYVQSKYGIHVHIKEHIKDIKHEFSHLIWNISVYSGYTEEQLQNTNQYRFVSLEEMANYPFPIPFQQMVPESSDDSSGAHSNEQ